jgi:hypothetical protein
MDSLQGLILERSRTDLEEAQIRSATAAIPLMPHVMYSPRLYHDGFQWVAVWGVEAGSKVVGRGDCPQDALYHFDSIWRGQDNKGVE